jgi:hypothetical protein
MLIRQGRATKHPLSDFIRRCSFPNDSLAATKAPIHRLQLVQSLPALDHLCAMLRDPLAI